MELDQKYIKKWVQRSTPINDETLTVHEETHRDNTEDLDKNIEMVFKETRRNELHEPHLLPKLDEENPIKNGLSEVENNSHTNLNDIATGSISSRLAEEKSKKLLNIKESSEDEHDENDENLG